MDEMKENMKRTNPVEDLVHRTDSPFVPPINAHPLPPKYKMPSLDSYDGTRDPFDHIATFKTTMHLQGVPDEIMCRAFPTTLKGPVRVWFSKIPPSTVTSFEELSKLFVNNFIGGQRHKRSSSSLLTIEQGENESLRSFITRFNREALAVDEMDDKLLLAAFHNGVHSDLFIHKLYEQEPQTMAELVHSAQNFMNAENAIIAKKRKRIEKMDANPARHSEQGPRLKKGRTEDKKDRDRKAEKMKGDPNKRNRNKYCRFHRDHGHDTDECFDLKQQIENLIRQGKLRSFLGRDHKDDKLKGKAEELPRPPLGEIRVIVGGSSTVQSSRSRKTYLKVVQSVQLSGRPPRDLNEQAITFTEEEAERIHHPHDDAIVITLLIADYTTRRVLVDNGSSADILYLPAFQQMKLGRDRLRPVNSPLVGFGGMRVQPVGTVTLPVVVGAYPQQVTKDVSFLVVDCSSSYNAIIGRPTLNSWRAVMSTYHLSVKFPTDYGVGQVQGDQLAARECYLAMLATDEQVQTMTIEEKRVVVEPIEVLEDVPLDERNPERCTRVGADLERGVKENLVQFLRKNVDVFAWSHEDMPGIDPNVITHRLNVCPSSKPIRQKKRVFAPERENAIKDEVQKLMAAKFIREVYYPDCYPLPRIDQLVDSTAGHKLLSFMDAFSGYNQIRMDKVDQEKTSFVTSQGLFCYEVMPFGLKNARATYQRLVNHMFRPQIGRNVEVYVDDMLVKSLEEGKHLDDLQETFNTLRRYSMKLNPSKCAFGVASGKFLGFMVSHRGIEANPEKIKAIQEMKPPQNIKEVQSLTGRVAALNRFVSKATDKCLPFFKVLKKAFEWTDECQRAFQDLKTYLVMPPLLSPSVVGEELFLYLAVTPHAVSLALIREEAKVQKPVYYTSRALRGAEGRYPPIEKLAFALITASRKLRHYFQAHVINVMTDHPLKKAMNKLEAAGRLIQWAVELSEFDIRYQPRHAIKAQSLADFIAEFTPRCNDEVQEDKNWVVHVDGSSTQRAGGIGVVLQSTEGDKLKHRVRLQYRPTNNEVEYEALLKRLELAKSVEAESVLVLGDSSLIMGQINGTYEAKEERMKKYLERVLQLVEKFRKANFIQILREENAEADTLAKEASATGTTEEYDEIQYVPSVDLPEVQQIGNEENWMAPIVSYLKDGRLPEARDEAKKLRIKAARYVLMDEVLYRRGFSQPYLRCLAPEEANYVLREVHEGACGNHSGARSLIQKVVRAGYYWPTVQVDAKAYVKACDKCQRFSNVPRQPSEYLTPMMAPWPFAQWGLDILGPFPLGTRQMKFLVVGIDYFTKWVEAEPLAHITQQNVKNFVWKNIVCRTTVRTPTGETPFKLAYGSEAVIPAEVHMANHRVMSYEEKDNEEQLRLNLDLIDEVRTEAEHRAAKYKNLMARQYDARVKPRRFKIGDLVLRKVSLATKNSAHGKLGPNWEGPYRVINFKRQGSYYLEALDGRKLEHPWNVEHLRRYYQ
ncbi:uncharacterized protein LOC126718038 [Quercus robur]|uniref:uncharacterized protein LOC126718038 n=1 Tax=Quercus robur TaxID=38942 RepID=UPI002162CBE3|nr:uncharacterized protein LOC126718038 [Quercus robur]